MGTVTLRWVESTLMVGTDSIGNSIAIGRIKDSEHFEGMKPSDLILLSAASCSMYDIIEILSKQREPVKNIRVICSGTQKEQPPYNYTSIHLHYVVEGGVDPEKIAKAIKLSEEKYCSIINTLKIGVPMTSDYEALP